MSEEHEQKTIVNKPSFFRQAIDLTSEVSGTIAACFLLIVAIIVTYEALMRYLFSSPTIWVNQFSIYLCIGIGFLGAPYALKRDAHFSVTFIVDKLSKPNRRILQIITHLMGIGYTLIFIYKGIHMVKVSYDLGEVSSGLMAVPLWIPQLFVPFGCTLLLLQFLNKLGEVIKKDSNPSKIGEN